ITFLGATEGRARYLMVEQAGSEPEIARRSNSGAVRSRNLHGCSPLKASMKAGRSGCHSGGRAARIVEMKATNGVRATSSLDLNQLTKTRRMAQGPEPLERIRSIVSALLQ